MKKGVITIIHAFIVTLAINQKQYTNICMSVRFFTYQPKCSKNASNQERN